MNPQLSFPCQRCNAPSGEACRTATGKVALITHSIRNKDLVASREAEDRANERAMDVKYRWSERFLTAARLDADLKLLPRGFGKIHAARLGERWGMHPEVIKILMDYMCPVRIECFPSWDPEDTDDGTFSADQEEWFVKVKAERPPSQSSRASK